MTKHYILLAAACAALLSGCATEGTQESAARTGPDETYVPTGSSIARRTVDRASAVKGISKEDVENSRMMGGGTLNLPQN
jgi:hypothetical protein